MKRRKLGDPAPDKLRITNGFIYKADGANLQRYFKEYQEFYNIPDGTQICVVKKSCAERLEAEILMLRAMVGVG